MDHKNNLLVNIETGWLGFWIMIGLIFFGG